jgi:amino acid adenylation domain-containing protein
MPMVSISKLIDNQSVLNPHKIAIKHGERTFTYKSVNELSNQLTRYLQDQNIQTGDVAGMAIDRSPEMVIALLALKKTGAVYLPVDNENPTDRIDYMHNDCAVKVLITSRSYKTKYAAVSSIIYIEDALEECVNYSRENIDQEVDQNSLAYILYTSGSTGKPKGVGIKHSSLLNLLLSVQQEPGINEDDSVLSSTTISFDIAELEIFLPLISGARLVIADAATVRDTRELLLLAKEEKLTIMQGAPYMWRMLIEGGWTERLPVKIFCGGEALTKELSEKLLMRCDSLWNMYGPTETTIYSIIKNVSADDEIITVGKPILNTQVYILDSAFNEVNKGEVGEICIGGAGVADGYINRPDLTTEKFIDDTFSNQKGQKIYRTGDLGKVLENGEIQCLGRIDHQIKIRGIRIESEEIELQLKQQKNINDALIILHQDALNNAHLVAYIVPTRPIKENNVEEFIKLWKTALRVTLPEYMVPDSYMIIPSFPLMLNGKLDRKALPEPTLRHHHLKNTDKPQTPIEISLAEILKQHIAVDEIGLNDNLFDFGIDSLVAVSIIVQIENKFGERLPVSILKQYPTIKQLAEAIISKPHAAYKSLIAIQSEGSKIPLYIVHGSGLNVFHLFDLAALLDKDQPVYGLRAYGLDGTVEPLDNIEAMAQFYNDEIIKHNPQGPYAIAGHSLGGYIAYEMVAQLKKMGKEVKMLGMFDTNLQYPTHHYPQPKKIAAKLLRQFRKARFRTQTLANEPSKTWAYLNIYYGQKFNLFLKRIGILKEYDPQNLPDFMQKIAQKLDIALNNYVVKPHDIHIDLFKAEERIYYIDDPKLLGWGKYALKGITIHSIPGDHKVMFDPPNDKILAKALQNRLDKANESK